MAEQYPYDLNQPAFAADIDPQQVWEDGQLGELLHRFVRTAEQGKSGITLLTGVSGCGKTLLGQVLNLRLRNQDRSVVHISQPHYQVADLLADICQQLDALEPSVAETGAEQCQSALDKCLLELYTRRRHVTLIVDDAQDLTNDVLTAINDLAPLQASTPRLLHIILLATPVLTERLLDNTLAAVSDGITARAELQALSAAQTVNYISWWVNKAGSERQLFSRQAMQKIHHVSGGVPALINRLSERALAIAVASSRPRVGEKSVREAAAEIMPSQISYYVLRHTRWLVVLLLFAAIAGFGIWWFQHTVDKSHHVRTVATQGASSEEQIETLRQTLAAPGKTATDTWSELLARWQVSSKDATPTSAARCEAVIFPGFNCVGGTATIDQLARFNRPLVLNFELDDNAYPVLLLGVGSTHVRLFIGTDTLEMSRAALNRVWRGHFYAPYRLPDDLPTVLRKGDKGDDIVWLTNRLLLAEGEKELTQTQILVFDDALETKVKALQRRFGIPADGIVGSETLFAIMSLDDNGPHLQRGVP